MRLKDKVAIVVGAGQSPGEGMGNGRATALTFAREGAKVLCVDHNLASAQETVDLIAEKTGHSRRLQGGRHQERRAQGDGRRRHDALGPDRHPAQ
jgi:NAD(P)-dependent dehydrogenase (short-subunit alcohol dehydrogenase family)